VLEDIRTVVVWQNGDYGNIKMKKILFFAYRDWMIDIFKQIHDNVDGFVLATNRNLCNMDFINCINPDIIFFYGWSWMVDKEIIDNYLCLCLHPSKLPKYRGGTPIQNQIINGEKESAVTIFKMQEGLDDGPIYFQENFNLNGYLYEILNRIKELGIKGTKQFISDFKNNTVKFIKQDEQGATIFKRLKPSDSEIKPEYFSQHDAEYFYNKIRGLQEPYPEVYIKCKTGKIIFKEIDYEL